MDDGEVPSFGGGGDGFDGAVWFQRSANESDMGMCGRHWSRYEQERIKGTVAQIGNRAATFM